MESKDNQLIQSNNQQVFDFFDPVQFGTMQRVCKMFASSELVPPLYKTSENNPESKATANCMIAISMAMRIGADPLMVMQNMIIIHGRPSWSSKFLIATVNSCGKFNPLQFKILEKGLLGKVEYTEYYNRQATVKIFDGSKIMNIECIAFTTAKGRTEVLESSPISIELAIKEGWYTKSGSKWQTMARQMLIYRAASFWTSAYAPETCMGMKTAEEVRDIVDVEFEDISETVEKEITEKANKIPLAISEEPTATPIDAAETKATKATKPAEPAQKKMFTGPPF